MIKTKSYSDYPYWLTWITIGQIVFVVFLVNYQFFFVVDQDVNDKAIIGRLFSIFTSALLVILIILLKNYLSKIRAPKLNQYKYGTWALMFIIIYIGLIGLVWALNVGSFPWYMHMIFLALITPPLLLTLLSINQ